MSADPGLYAHGVAWAEERTGTLLSGGALERAALTKRRSSSVADTRTHPSRLERLRATYPSPARDVDVGRDLVAFLPSLRAFAISPCGNRDLADDPVQDTVERAWQAQDRFAQGSNLHAWPFTILRNAFVSRCRRSGREVEDPEGIHARRLADLPNQLAVLDLDDLLRALAALPIELREGASCASGTSARMRRRARRSAWRPRAFPTRSR